MKAHRAFTLIELLVVIAILALLISILVPAISTAKRLAKRVVCGANLKSWHSALSLYYSEHGYLPGTWRKGVGPSVLYSDLARELQGQAPSSEISFEKVSPYLVGFDPITGADQGIWRLSGAWICPAVCKQAEVLNPGWFQGSSAHVQYAYYARSSEWSWPPKYGPGDPRGSTNLDELVDITLEEGQLLMSDMVLCRRVFHNPPTGFYTYNHGSKGPYPLLGVSWDADQVWDETSDNITGMNHVYGNGSVEWISRNEMALDDDLQRRTGEHDY